MPQYSFKCFEDEDGCGYVFSIVSTIEEISDLKITCPNCKKRRSVFRDFAADTISVDAGPQTLGSMADKNSSSMTTDHKRHLQEKHNEYRKSGPRRKLPKGMKYVNENN